MSTILFDKVYSALYNDSAHLDKVSLGEETVYLPDQLKTKNSILVLHGGVDISPSLYNKAPHPLNQAGEALGHRDILERKLYLRAVELGIPVLGICRGAQLACALNGGSLVQHVKGHISGNHTLELKDGSFIPANSCHHQMMYPWDVKGMELLGWSSSKISNTYQGEKPEEELDMRAEPEIVWFDHTKTLAIQGHPEWLPYNSALVQYMIKTLREKL